MLRFTALSWKLHAENLIRRVWKPLNVSKTFTKSFSAGRVHMRVYTNPSLTVVSLIIFCTLPW